MLELRGYITNLGKYNEGELVGKWISFPIEEEELQEVLKEIGCCYYDEEGEYTNTSYEEYFFTDYESEIDLDLREYTSIDTLNVIAEQLQDWDKETLKAACDVWSLSEVLENDPGDYMILSDVHNYYDLGYYWIEESGCYDLKGLESIRNYIDYESFGRDVYLETNSGFSNYGYIEYIG